MRERECVLEREQVCVWGCVGVWVCGVNKRVREKRKKERKKERKKM